MFRIAALTTAQLPMTLAVDAEGISLERFFADLGLPGTGLSGEAALRRRAALGRRRHHARQRRRPARRPRGAGRLAGPRAVRHPDGGRRPARGDARPHRVRELRAALSARRRSSSPEGSRSATGSRISISICVPATSPRPIASFRTSSRRAEASPSRSVSAAPARSPGHLGRTWSNPEATVQVTAEDARYGGVLFGSARGTVDMSDGAFLFRPLRVYEGDATLSLEGRAAYRSHPGRAGLRSRGLGEASSRSRACSSTSTSICRSTGG